MTHGIRSTACGALAWGALALGCAPAPPDPAQLATVDSLITTTAAALLTLNELDAGRYARLDSLFRSADAHFRDRFNDTLDTATARLLGDQYLLLRQAGRIGDDQLRMATDLATTKERLHALRTDLAHGAIAPADARTHIDQESRTVGRLMAALDTVIGNYRAAQLAWERRDTVERLLSAP